MTINNFHNFDDDSLGKPRLYRSGAAKKNTQKRWVDPRFPMVLGYLFSTSSAGGSLPAQTAQTTPTMANFIAAD
jgi:hypothetical protein